MSASYYPTPPDSVLRSQQDRDALQKYAGAIGVMTPNETAILVRGGEIINDYRQRVLDLDDALTHLEKWIQHNASLWDRLRYFAWIRRRIKAAHGQARKVRERR